MTPMVIEYIQADWLLSPGQEPISNQHVGFDKNSGCITSIDDDDASSNSDVQGSFIVTPGLINAHTHLELYRENPIELKADETFSDWVIRVVAYAKAMTDTEKQQASQKSILELIRGGVTCVNDITSTGMSLEALSMIGMRGIVSPEFFHPQHLDFPDVSVIVQRFKELQERFKGHPLLQVGLSPHSPYNVTSQAWQMALEQTKPSLIHTHLSETDAEEGWFEQGHSDLDRIHETLLGERYGPTQKGNTSTQSIQQVLNSNTVAAHGVFLSEEDITVIETKGVSMVHCPQSNQWFGNNPAQMPLKAFMDRNIPVGLGTDSRLSCAQLDLREEGRLAQRCHELPSKQVFELMTLGSAKAMHMESVIGQLTPGYAADMVLWYSPETIQDGQKVYDAWLDPKTQPVCVWVNGRMVMERSLEAV